MGRWSSAPPTSFSAARPTRPAGASPSVAVGSVIGGFQQARFIVKMKRAHADARHRRDFLDCICHRFCRRRPPRVDAVSMHSRESRNVRVKEYFHAKHVFCNWRSGDSGNFEIVMATKRRKRRKNFFRFTLQPPITPSLHRFITLFWASPLFPSFPSVNLPLDMVNLKCFI